MKKLFTPEKWKLLLLSIGVWTMGNAVHAQTDLYAVQSNAGNFDLVHYDEITGAVTTLINFPTTYNGMSSLTYNIDDDIFYAIGDSDPSVVSHLLTIDPCTYNVTDLGPITLDGSSPCYVTEGLAYDPVSQELYGTLDTLINTYDSKIVVQYTLGTANCSTLGLIDETGGIPAIPAGNNEMDGLVFTETYAASSALFGMDGHPVSNFTHFCDIDYVGAGIGDAPAFAGTAFTWVHGLTYREDLDLVYTVGNGNVLNEIIPSYLVGPGTMTPTTTLLIPVGEVNTGLSWGPLLCCTAANDSLFVTVTDDINTNTYWGGKIYINDNTIITVDGAILDITTADVVFGECAGIDFINGAMLRANNSVFRPCAPDATWRGIRFVQGDNVNHQINESTFKNAERALYFDQASQGSINSNTFSNCNESITINNSINEEIPTDYTQSIVGNNFVTNNAYPAYSQCYDLTNPTDVIYILSNGRISSGARIPMIVSQNSMVMTNQSATLDVTGIDLLNCIASISENTLTNMSNGIVIQAPIGTTNIESNKLEINAIHTTVATSSSQISVFNSRGPFVFINNNEIINSREFPGYTRTAIFTESSANISVKNNTIDGFHWGIFVNNSTGINLSENLITSASRAGIFFDELDGPSENFITCNDITMKMDEGVSIWTRDATGSTSITSNCTKDGNIGIQTHGLGTIPYIRNNYIYNYSVGINNINHSGNIGTLADPGLNTLYSNNNSALDVQSTLSGLTMADNFGMWSFTGVTVTSGNPYHSTASCGHQISSSPSQGNLNIAFKCGNFDEFISPLGFGFEGFTSPSVNDLRNHLIDMENDYVTIIRAMDINPLSEIVVDELISSSNLTETQEVKIWYHYYKSIGNFELAKNQLAELDELEYSDFIKVESVHLKVLTGEELNVEYLNSLTELMADNDLSNSIYNLAVSISRSTANHGTYKYDHPTFIAVQPSSSDRISLEGDEALLSAYPNPFEDMLTVQIKSGSNLETQDLVVYNVFGEEVKRTSLDFVSGQITVELENLPSGTYFIALESETSISAKQAIIKM